ncbi:MAG: porin family protein [Gemmatimonadetes bacterium]|nr:MAG: hypothetical protein DMD67_16770 [Gemmatimonadota bacterium]PYO98277.1 MAG: hypothetical protein DMD61_10370 [Gemmatimonadota bacterium]TLY47157.1 MAG: porin family protein [Gemmatimonadota bacterium]
MNRVRQLATALAVTTFVALSSATAQSAYFGLGGGVTVPLSDYKDTDNAGWHVLGKVDIHIPMSPVGVRVDAIYSQTSQKAPATGNTKVAGGTVDVVWHIPTTVPGLKPYVVGGGGVFNYNAGGGSTTKFTWAAGLGASIGAGPIHAFAEARYISVQLTPTHLKFVPLTAGLSFGS